MLYVYCSWAYITYKQTISVKYSNGIKLCALYDMYMNTALQCLSQICETLYFL